MQEPPRGYLGSAQRLLKKRLAVISEAPSGYLGSAQCLFRKHPALIEEASRGYRRSAQRLFRKRPAVSRCEPMEHFFATTEKLQEAS